jgi:hypothetical protein
MDIRCGHCQKYHGSVAEVRECSSAQVTFTVEAPKPHPWRMTGAPKNVEPGLYENGTGIYKIKRSKGTHRLWAQKLVVLVGEDGKEHPKWEYASGAVYALKVEDQMTGDQAAKFGHQFHQCIECHRPLEHPESVRRGYGPICADKYGWDYDHSV